MHRIQRDLRGTTQSRHLSLIEMFINFWNLTCGLSQRLLLWIMTAAHFRFLGVRAAPVPTENPPVEQESPAISLAGGTQDLAALVGLFATDSVERYAVDYSRGYLSVAFATASLLGVLGYVRAIVKLALGSNACQASAFPTAPVRTMLGVAPADRLPMEELTSIHYIKREQLEDCVRYTSQKRLYHTEESFPATKALHGLRPKNRHYGVLDVDHKRSIVHRIAIWMCLLITAAATSFPILVINGDFDMPGEEQREQRLERSEPREWQMRDMMASYGMFAGLAISSILWSVIYMREQVLRPFNPIHPTQELSANNTVKGLSQGPEPPHFAILYPGGTDRCRTLAVCNIRTTTPAQFLACRLISFGIAGLICLCYIFQYLVVRGADSNRAAAWLGVQTLLALCRLLVWIYDPKFDDNKDVDFTPANLHGDGGECYFQGHLLASLHFGIRVKALHTGMVPWDEYHSQTLVIPALPNSINDFLSPQRPETVGDHVDQNAIVIRLLKEAQNMLNAADLHTFFEENGFRWSETWHFPPNLFAKWLRFHQLPTSNENRNPAVEAQYGAFIVLTKATPEFAIDNIKIVPYNVFIGRSGKRQMYVPSASMEPRLSLVVDCGSGDGKQYKLCNFHQKLWPDESTLGERTLRKARKELLQDLAATILYFEDRGHKTSPESNGKGGDYENPDADGSHVPEDVSLLKSGNIVENIEEIGPDVALLGRDSRQSTDSR